MNVKRVTRVVSVVAGGKPWFQPPEGQEAKAAKGSCKSPILVRGVAVYNAMSHSVLQVAASGVLYRMESNGI